MDNFQSLTLECKNCKPKERSIKIDHLYVHKAEQRAFDCHLRVIKKLLYQQRNKTKLYMQIYQRLTGMIQVLKILPNNVFSPSVKRCPLIFKTSFSKSRRLCWYFAGIGEWVFENSAADRAFLRKELNTWSLEESFSPKDTMPEEYIWIGTTAWGCCGMEVIRPWIHVS